MTTHDVRFGGSGIPETVIAKENSDVLEKIALALQQPAEERRDASAAVVAANPRSLMAWATLGDHGRDVIESYASYRVGYHRGLDTLRQSGWRGSGYVRWSHPENRGFLRCLAGLHRRAAEIGEYDEAERCELFLLQLEPGWPPPEFT